MVDLENVAGEHHFGVLARPGDDGLDLVRREVLGFVHDEVRVDQAAAADISQGRDHQLFFVEHFLEFSAAAFDGLNVLVLDHAEVVVQRLHVRAYFLVHASRKVAQVPVGQRDDGACQEYLFVIIALGERRGKGQKRFPRARFAGDRDQADIFIHQRVQGEHLFHVPGFDARRVHLGDVLDHHVFRVHTAQGGDFLVAGHHEFIGAEFIA